MSRSGFISSGRLLPLPLVLLAACAVGDANGADSAPVRAAAAESTPSNAPPADYDGPRAGRWTGVAEGGYKGDSILFTVAKGGREVSDVEFRGHWRCGPSPSSRRIKRMDVGHVPGTFTVAPAGDFGEEKREPYLLWTVSGQFAGDSASGTVRIEYDTECDTHKLTWRAVPLVP
jgi:hypothetical protein